MGPKVLWFVLAYCIVTNFYIDAEIFSSPKLFNLKEKLNLVKDLIGREEEGAKKLVAIKRIGNIWGKDMLQKLIAGKIKTITRIVRRDEVDPEGINFYLFTRDNRKGQKFTMNAVPYLNMTRRRGVKIICHGWNGNVLSPANEEMREAYLDTEDLNVIGVDWKVEATNIFYPLSAKKTEPVGKIVAKVIDQIAKLYGIPYKDFHFIGHSLGAHVGGFVGRNTKERLGRITGLDPALPGFEYVEIAGGRLSKENADFVDVIHTCVHLLGVTFPLGHADFYPNGGSPFQPGCSYKMVPQTVACSHIRVVSLFAKSIRNESNFLAIKCKDWNQFEKGNCPPEYTLMGERVNPKASGIYYLETSDVTPFYLGMNGTTVNAA